MLSAGYETECRFNRDSDTTATIRWYRAAEGAETLGYPSAITPLSWLNQPWIRKGVGEVFNADRRFFPGNPIPGALGKSVCGEESDFTHGGVYDPDSPPMQYAASGLPICCEGLPGGVVVGGERDNLDDYGGVVLGGSAQPTPPPPPPLGGVVLGGSAQPAGYCDTYTLTSDEIGEVLVTRVSPDGGVWVTDPPDVAQLNSSEDIGPAYWTVDSYVLGANFFNDGWDGIGCATFDWYFGTPSPPITVCCSD